MDEDHLVAAVRYVSLNPVGAGLATRPEHWAWSSVKAHLARKDDGLVDVAPVLARVDDFAALIATDPEGDDGHAGATQALRSAERAGRPLGTVEFVTDLERRLKRPLITSEIYCDG